MPAPRKPSRAPHLKASRPDLQPLDQRLAALNPALVEPQAARVRRGPAAEVRKPRPRERSARPDRRGGERRIAEGAAGAGRSQHPRAAAWTPHRPPRPEKSEGGRRLRVVSEFEPEGDQPQAIEELLKGVRAKERDQVLLGVTGSGKTFTMAKMIEATQQRLALAKTLAVAALRRVQELLSGEVVASISSPTTAIISPVGVRSAHRHLYREGIRHQRADRPHAPRRHPRGAGARRRHHRRLGPQHLTC